VDPINGVQEQALSVLKNLADDEPGINMVFQGIGSNILLDLLGRAVSSSDDDVVLQVSEIDLETYLGIKQRRRHLPSQTSRMARNHNKTL
jgi:hypothetical protein